MAELDQLKKLLLADELEEIKQLASKLKTLEFESYDEATITAKILPLFDTVLLKKLEEKESHTIQILSQHLAQVILKSSQKDLPALSHSLQSVISPAISREIEENKDKMVDTLYPIMGGMISKYVSQAIKEMMETINTKIEDGLSFDRYKRKVKAKVSGVSETELLIQESNETHISALFVIHKESGLLISEAHLDDHEIDDPYMVASMASAIKDFINDWINTEETTSTNEVQLMSYGENTLYIESAGSVYLIAFLDAEPTQEQRREINMLFAKIVKDHSPYLQVFDGDDSGKEIEEISERMHLFLLDHNEPSERKEVSRKKRDPSKLILSLLGIGIIAYLLYQYRYSYADHLLEKRILETTKQKIHVTHREGKYYLSGSIDSMEHFYTIKKLLGDQPFTHALQMPIEELAQKLASQEKYTKEKIAYLEKKFDLFSTAHNSLQSHIRQIEHIATLKNSILKKLSKVFNKDTDLYKEDGSLDFRTKKLFHRGEILPNAEALKILESYFTRYIETLMDNKEINPYIKGFAIEGYINNSENLVYNDELSVKHTNQIRSYLLALPISKKYQLDTMIYTRDTENKNTILTQDIKDKEASRRIKLRFVLDSEKMIHTIKSSLND